MTSQELSPGDGIASPRVALVTGASSGFGLLLVPLLLARGWAVIAGLRGGESRLREVLGKESARYGARLAALDIHMEREETFEAARKLVDEEFGGKLDVLVNNAGYGLFGALEDQTASQLRQQMEVNFFGPVLLTKKLLPALCSARGRVINVSSIAGRFTFPLYGPYNASKFALEAMSEALHYELRPFGVQVGLIEPGGFRTSFNRGKTMAEGSYNESSLYFRRTRKLEDFLMNTSARQGDPARVARKLVQLCERNRIPLRTPIGYDAFALTWISKFIPDSWRVKLEELAFRKIVFRE